MINNIKKNNKDLETFITVNQFSNEDLSRLKKMSDVVTPKLMELTDRFYEQLMKEEGMVEILDGRIDSLKKSHYEWLSALFDGVYDQDYIDLQRNIGDIHAKEKVSPLFVSSSMSYLRTEISDLITDEEAASISESRADCIASIYRILDMNHFLIESTYYRRLMNILGISEALLGRLMTV